MRDSSSVVIGSSDSHTAVWKAAGIERGDAFSIARTASVQTLEDLDRQLRALTSVSLPSERSVDSRALLSTVIEYLEGFKSREFSDGVFERERSHVESDAREMVGQLKAIYERVGPKQQALEEQRQLATKRLQEASTLLTDLSDDPAGQPKHRYTLRGVSTEPHVTYVLKPVQNEDVEMSGETGEWAESFPRYQWWRISYVPTDDIAKPVVSKMMVSEDDVLLAAREEGSGSVLVVYGSEKAIDPDLRSELPAPLKTFVEKDNAAFSREIQAHNHDQHQSRQHADDSHHDGVTSRNVEMVETSRSGSRGDELGGIRRTRASSEDSTEVLWGGITPPSPPPPGTLPLPGAAGNQSESSGFALPPAETMGFDGASDERVHGHDQDDPERHHGDGDGTGAVASGATETGMRNREEETDEIE